jgi:hypothetical protein
MIDNKALDVVTFLTILTILIQQSCHLADRIATWRKYCVNNLLTISKVSKYLQPIKQKRQPEIGLPFINSSSN